MEKDNAVKGAGNSYDFGARIYDARLGKFLTKDPWEAKYSWQTPYAYYANRPVTQIDWNGYGDGDGDKKEGEGDQSGDDDKSQSSEDTPKEDNTSTLEGWNQIVEKFNEDLHAAIWERTSRKGPELLYQDAVNFADNTLTFLSDITMISNLVGKKNSTYEALENAIATAWNLPNMTNEERGRVYAAATIGILSMVVTRRIPFKKIPNLSVIRVKTSKKGILKQDILVDNKYEALKWARQKLGHNTTKLRNPENGQVIGWTNGKDKVYWGHGDWGKGKGSSTYPHLNYEIGNTKGHLFLKDKIINKKMDDSFIEYFNLGQ